MISGALFNAGMKTVEEVRRVRLQELKATFGSFAAINKALNRTPTDSTLSQIANQASGSKTDKPKTMGSPQARAIEAALKLEAGWMDTDPQLVAAAANAPRSWPFPGIDMAKVAALDADSINRLEGALLLTAAQLGKDVAAQRPENRKAA
ncbi:hypothetical protein C7T35_01270 [Variovorax sp. WS11]|nr:hypothetical protein C7T35_01270 [Variovorax sp. WS11]